MACVTKLPDPEKSISEASALQRAAALEEYGEDVASYSKRLDEKPADCATLCNRAFCYVKLGKFEEARKDAEACIASDETFARGHTRLAQALERSDRPAALRACRRALALDRDDAMALKLLTTLDLDVAAGLRVKKRLADAVEDRRDAVRGALSKGEAAPFCKKWAKLDEKSRKQLVERCVKIKIYGAFALNRRVVLYAIGATPARRRGDVVSSPLDGASTAAPDALVDFHTGRTHAHAGLQRDQGLLPGGLLPRPGRRLRDGRRPAQNEAGRGHARAPGRLRRVHGRFDARRRAAIERAAARARGHARPVEGRRRH
jgi:tetratricopeptide (TPR) repeat protein